MTDGPLSYEEFEILMAPYMDMVAQGCAVAVSGGPDSMALVYLLSKFVPVKAVTVDHGLRPEATAEAEQVGRWLSNFPNIEHHILTREVKGDGASRIQEDARHDRYALMAEFCQSYNVKALCVAHHQEDQAETFLFRLAKGSGLDGLGCMRDVQDMRGVMLLRPFLDISKQRLVATCKANNITYVTDPSNQNDKFARVRLRQSADILAAEGLTSKRLEVTSKRLSRARDALDFYAEEAFQEAVIKGSAAHRIEFVATEFDRLPEEITLRCLLKAYRVLLAQDYDYGPRMERLEDLHNRLRADQTFKGATLGGCIVRRDAGKKLIIVELEQKDATLN